MSIIARINNQGKLKITDEIIEYPAELEGGRNLIRNGDFSKGLTNWSNQGYSLSIIDGVLIAKNVSGTGTRFYYDIIQMPVGETYTISFEAKTDKNNSEIFLGQGADSSNIGTISLTTVWKRYNITFQSVNNFTISFHLRESDVDYYFTNIKLEKGSQATSWTPAPEDLGLEYPDDIQHFSTGFRSNGKVLVHEFIEGEDFSFSYDKKMYLNELEEGVDL